MNKVEQIGRLTRDPEVRYSQGENSIAIARYTIAVQSKRKDSNGNYLSDFIPCVAMGKLGEFAEKYLKKGMKIAVSGHLQSGSYTNKEGVKVYTLDVVVEEQEFCEKKDASDGVNTTNTPTIETDENGFMNIPEGIDEELPFN